MRTLCVAILFAIASLGAAVYAENNSAAGVATRRTVEQIQQDIDAACKVPAVAAMFNSTAVLSDKARRDKLAPEALPQLKMLLRLADELAATQKDRASGQHLRKFVLPMLALFEDSEVVARLDTMSKSTDVKESSTAKSALLLARWWKGSTDAVEQGKVIEDARLLAESNPESETLSQALMAMGQGGAANPELRDRALSIITQAMKGEAVAPLQKQVADLQKFYALENKPLEVEGVRFNGAMFTTADWKGKVVLIDFWATWCGPCVADLPKVKKIYAEYHDKGLEVLGISCDNSSAALKKFLDANRDMPWPQLFDEKTKGWHPLASQYGVVAVPAMLLIDKKSIVRTVQAQENFERLIPQLLAEE